MKTLFIIIAIVVLLYEILSPFFGNKLKYVPKYINQKVPDTIEREYSNEIIIREVEVADTSGSIVASPFSKELTIF